MTEAPPPDSTRTNDAVALPRCCAPSVALCWNMDNYPSGPNGFLEHHCSPAALSRRSLWTNVRDSAAQP